MQTLELRWMENGERKARQYHSADLYDILEDIFTAQFMHHSMIRLLVVDEKGEAVPGTIRCLTRPDDVRRYIQDILHRTYKFGTLNDPARCV